MFECMIRSTKQCLKKKIGRANLSYDELLTAIAVVKSVINSRRLLYITSDDLEEPLTPSHFLSGCGLLNLPDSVSRPDDEDFDVSVVYFTKHWRHLNKVIAGFWRCWKEEYLIELLDHHQYRGQSSSSNSISVGDVVILHNESKPHGFWKLAQIQELLKGKDERVRGAIVTVPVKDGYVKTLSRPLQRPFIHWRRNIRQLIRLLLMKTTILVLMREHQAGLNARQLWMLEVRSRQSTFPNMNSKIFNSRTNVLYLNILVPC